MFSTNHTTSPAPTVATAALITPSFREQIAALRVGDRVVIGADDNGYTDKDRTLTVTSVTRTVVYLDNNPHERFHRNGPRYGLAYNAAGSYNPSIKKVLPAETADAQRIARACIRANAHTTTQQALGKLPTAPLTPVVIKEVIEWR